MKKRTVPMIALAIVLALTGVFAFAGCQGSSPPTAQESSGNDSYTHARDRAMAMHPGEKVCFSWYNTIRWRVEIDCVTADGEPTGFDFGPGLLRDQPTLYNYLNQDKDGDNCKNSPFCDCDVSTIECVAWWDGVRYRWKCDFGDCGVSINLP